ncbi:hypothetical protein N865_16680 [Intrasporangium oryzae NRRL B-24470]|uniref:DUF4231 domain-containing protein n=1 Tax=Intrasporangium oryzae NRRL B-24470 TaxID=1386089 RepID=W9G4L3_9MICO|nr:DUF4231 domain-containing protein [Intrasporangium oryzae]EWT00247.1 hypothetical protein N865_16680 [Intrasporangium oryzae NRRL B-24470]
MSEVPDMMGDELPKPTNPDDVTDLVWLAFQSQFAFFSKGSRRNRVAYQSSKVATIVIAAAVTICAALDVRPWVTASLGGLVVVIQGLQQLFQWQLNWVTDRQSSETMRQHGLAYAAMMDPYDGPDRRDRLSKLMRDIALRENRSWAGRMLDRGSR